MGQPEKPKEQQADPKERAKNVFQEASNKIEELVTGAKEGTAEAFTDVHAHILRAKEHVKHVGKEEIDKLRDQMTKLKPVLDQLKPDVEKVMPKRTIEELRKWMTENTQDFLKGYGEFAKADANAVKDMAKSGMDKFLTSVSDGLGKLGEWAQQAWDYVKPYLAKLVDNPAAKWILGEEKLNTLKGYLGRSVEVEKLKEELTPLLPVEKNVGLDIDTKGLTAFTQKYRKMVRLKNQTEANYTKADYFDELIGKNAINFDALEAGEDGKRTLTMQDVVKAAETYNQKVEAERKQTQAPQPPPAAPAAPTPPSANAA